jgi:hypothetical protein
MHTSTWVSNIVRDLRFIKSEQLFWGTRGGGHLLTFKVWMLFVHRDWERELFNRYKFPSLLRIKSSQETVQNKFSRALDYRFAFLDHYSKRHSRGSKFISWWSSPGLEEWDLDKSNEKCPSPHWWVRAIYTERIGVMSCFRKFMNQLNGIFLSNTKEMFFHF